MLTCNNCVHKSVCLSCVGSEYMHLNEDEISTTLTEEDIRKLCLDFALDWISPDIELPKDGERVLVQDKDGNIDIARFRQYQTTSTSPTFNRWLDYSTVPKFWKPIS